MTPANVGRRVQLAAIVVGALCIVVAMAVVGWR